ncbi:hypothetical protein FHT37_003224 [Mitsuaria sp. BK037]|nr:hypothetical protein [Mitsuaria sp. BK037]
MTNCGQDVTAHGIRPKVCAQFSLKLDGLRERTQWLEEMEEHS